MKLNSSLFKTLILNLFMIVLISDASAEYRVYQYSVKYKTLYEVDTKPYLVTSTLDPVSYVAYHGGSQTMAVDLLRSWTCKGHTGQLKAYCPSPYEKAKEVKGF